MQNWGVETVLGWLDFVEGPRHSGLRHKSAAIFGWQGAQASAACARVTIKAERRRGQNCTRRRTMGFEKNVNA